MVKKILKTKKQIKKYKGGAGKSVIQLCDKFISHIKNIKEVLPPNITTFIEKELEIFIQKTMPANILNTNATVSAPNTLNAIVRLIIRKSITELLTNKSTNKTIKNIPLQRYYEKNTVKLNEINLFDKFKINEKYLNDYKTELTKLQNNKSTLTNNKLQNLAKTITTQQTETIKLSNTNLNNLFKNRTIPAINLNRLFIPNNCTPVITNNVN